MKDIKDFFESEIRCQKAMRNNVFIILMIVFLKCIYSCADEDKFEGQKLCDLISRMIESDQSNRMLTIDPFFKILDSIRTSEGLDKSAYAALPTERQKYYGHMAREIADRTARKFSKREHDSIMNAQIAIDNKNTELLIEIIETRGFPNKENTKCEKFPGMIFAHSQKKYWDRINQLIEEELKAGRLEKNTYHHIKWHTSGRKGRVNFEK